MIVSYLQLGFPISTKKMERRGTTWGVSFGLRPLTRINYKIEQLGRIANVDSSKTIYEGNGGMNQVNVSTGIKKIGKGARRNEFSIGASSGYTFGTRDYSTRTSLINDSVTYYKSNYQVESRFGGVFINTGVQYEMHLKDAGTLRLGAYANLKQNLNAYQTTRIETFGFDGNGGIAPIDSVYKMTDVKGKVIVPVIFGIGFTFRSKDNQWLFGADYEFSNWASYRSYNEKDYTANSWTIRAGAEFYPAKSTAADNKYWNYIKYRAGFYYGPDYIYINAVRKNYAATLGASLPLTSPRFIQSRGEYVCLNTSLEYGVRGNRESLGLRESFMRINFGISMNARWFQKRSYD